MDILRTVDVAANAGQPHDQRFNTMLTGDLQMRKKAVFAKGKGYDVRRRHQNGVGAKVVMRGDNGERRRWLVKPQKLADLFVGDERNIARYLQHATALFTGETLSRSGDDGCMATL